MDDGDGGRRCGRRPVQGGRDITKEWTGWYKERTETRSSPDSTLEAAGNDDMGFQKRWMGGGGERRTGRSGQNERKERLREPWPHLHFEESGLPGVPCPAKIFLAGQPQQRMEKTAPTFEQ